MPLLRKEAFLEAAEALHSRLAAHGCVDYDSAGSVGEDVLWVHLVEGVRALVA